MKCQYESEILYKLMERDGFNIPSSVPPYESEIKDYLINQVKQAYPKLTDYEAEWLLYNYTKHLPADFPISSVSDVTEATFENVVPFVYQSAILKGRTLVNLCDLTNIVTINKANVVDKTITIEPTGYIHIGLKSELSSSEIYTLMLKNFEGDTSTIQANLSNNLGSAWTGTVIKTTIVDNCVLRVIQLKQGATEFIIRIRNSGESNITFTPMFLIGEETIEQNYFEGLSSVKMPALTTTGKNLCGELEQGSISSSDGTLTASNTRLRTTNFITLPPGTYTVSINSSFDWVYRMFDVNGKFLSAPSDWNSAIPTITETRKIKLVIKRKDNLSLSPTDSVEIQLEQGTQSTSYEPYKSNILSCNEEVELRGIGDVQDTLDCLTGEVTQRIGEVVLDGSEEWTFNRATINHNLWVTTIPNPALNTSVRKNNMLCNKLIVEDFAGFDDKDYEFITINNGNSKLIYLKLDKTKGSTLTELKNYLQSNPLTVQYQLATESIKTVGLTTVNEKGESVDFIPIEGTMNVQSSGEIIQPTFDMSVPVEATTQNLASFINLEME